MPPQTSFADNFAAPAFGNQLSTNWIENAGNFTVNAQSGTATGQSALNEATVANLSMTNATLQAKATFTAAGQYFGMLARYAGPGRHQRLTWPRWSSLGTGKVQVYLMKNTGSGWVSLAAKNGAELCRRREVPGHRQHAQPRPSTAILILSITDKSIASPRVSVGVRSSAEVAVRDFNVVFRPTSEPALQMRVRMSLAGELELRKEPG